MLGHSTHAMTRRSQPSSLGTGRTLAAVWPVWLENARFTKRSVGGSYEGTVLHGRGPYRTHAPRLMHSCLSSKVATTCCESLIAFDIGQLAMTTLGEKMGSAHMNPAQGTAAQASAIIGIGLANFGGMPVSTTHVLSAAVLGSVAGTKGEKVNMHTVGKIAMTWATTLPGTVIVSFVLSLIFYVALV
jgi:Phosphate transporter family